MDKKRSNIHLVRNGGRKVTKTTTEYDWNRLDKNGILPSAKSRGERRLKGNSELEKKVRYQKKQRAHRLKMQRRRTLAVLILALILVFVILFLTPVFNIRSVSVEGNRIVTEEQFTEILKPLIGENLLRTGGGKISKMLKTIPYIETVKVEKSIFPPSLKVTVTEYTPGGLIRTEGKSILVDPNLHVLADTGETMGPVPAVTGFEVKSCEVGKDIKADDKEKAEAVITALSTLDATGILDKVVEINVYDLADITMNYDDRITVKCGTSLNLERKLRLFRETVVSNSLAENARGTMDLSETGKAIYTP